MANQNSETRNPLFLAFVSVILGAALWIWGAVRADCSDPNCWHGSGFLIGAGVTLVLGGIGYGFIAGNRK